MATSLSILISDTSGCVIDQRFALAAVFGRPRRNSKKSYAGSQSQRASRSFPCHQVRSESETQLTLVKQLKSARVTIRKTQESRSTRTRAATFQRTRRIWVYPRQTRN